ncbi:hypothetical protein RP20_CCG012238 [Aedes albopictus]|nr:hypothetical protein RP20_CCG012238 [Aedes albopictus]
MLETSMQLVGVTDEYTKVRLFKIKAGSKLLSILENTSSPAEAPSPESYPYSNAVTRLQNFFGSRDYRLMQRQKLRSMTQNVGESDVKYVKRVVAVAKLCDFNDEQLMENVAYVIQSHAPNPKIREISRKILRKGGSIATLLEKIQAYELERVHEDIYQKNHSQQPRSTVATVTSEQPSRQSEENDSQQGSIFQIMRNGNNRHRNEALGRQAFGRSDANRGRGVFNRRGPGRGNSSACWRCTSPFHTPENCHAIRKICRNCQRKGHIERACRQSQSFNGQKRKSNAAVDEPSTKIRKLDAVSDDETKIENSHPVSMLNSTC